MTNDQSESGVGLRLKRTRECEEVRCRDLASLGLGEVGHRSRVNPCLSVVVALTAQ